MSLQDLGFAATESEIANPRLDDENGDEDADDKYDDRTMRTMMINWMLSGW